MIFIEVRKKSGELRHRWKIEGPDISHLPFEERVKERERLIMRYMDAMRSNVALFFDPKETEFFIVFESKIRQVEHNVFSEEQIISVSG